MTAPLCARLTLLTASLALAACASRGNLVRVDDQPRASEGRTVAAFDDAVTGAPRGWRLETTNPRKGRGAATWAVRASADAPSAPNVLSLTDARGNQGQTFHLAWRDDVALADVDVTVRVQANAGDEDRGGGPAWRIQDASNYYVARWNPLEDNFRVYSVQNGERLQLDSARVRADPDAWHTLRIRQVGPRIEGWFDGERLLEATDTKLPGPGGVGVWTKADAATSFDDLVHGEAAR